MKKFKNIALLGATALVGVVGFSACSSDDDPTSNTIEATGETVKTAFTLSITNQAQTRMTTGEAGETQDATNFAGIQDIYLFPVITGNISTPIGDASTLSLNSIRLANWASFETRLSALQAKVYNDVAIPVGVDHFLFYGRRITTNTEGKLNFDFSTITTSSTPQDINFELDPIYENNTVSAEQGAKDIITAMNDIDAALTTAKATTTDLEKYATNWEAMTAGSATTVAAAVSDLYASMKTLKGTSTNTDYDNVMTAITNYFTIDDANYDAKGTVVAKWKSTDAAGFPASINLPDGAVSVVYTASNVFEYTGNGVVAKDENTTPHEYTAVNNYVKPAELFYYVNSPVGTADKIILGDNNITLPTTWDGLFTTGQDYSYAKKAVSVNTKSVILENQIQYAVGRLETTVQVAKVSGGILDHGTDKTTPATEPATVSVPDDGFKVTGVLIGGQKNVGWDFTPNGTDEWTIYDGTMPAAGIYAKTGTVSAANHTLALETAADAHVRICVEFENGDNDFYGHDGELIPANTKFYLVAELDPTKATGYAANTMNQVFKQDYVTKVNLTIGQNSLKNAYQTIPDLRSPKLEFGFSVDLTWQSGLTFEQNFDED